MRTTKPQLSYFIDFILVAVAFFLFLIGLCGISVVLIYPYLMHNILLLISVTSLMWAFILSMLYVLFRYFDLDFWS